MRTSRPAPIKRAIVVSAMPAARSCSRLMWPRCSSATAASRSSLPPETDTGVPTPRTSTMLGRSCSLSGHQRPSVAGGVGAGTLVSGRRWWPTPWTIPPESAAEGGFDAPVTHFLRSRDSYAPRVPSPLLVVDGPFVLYRSFFALPDSIKGTEDRSINALLGAVNVLLRIAADRQPRAIVVCFGAASA